MNEDIMKATGFEEEIVLVKESRCPFCQNVVDMNFRDSLSEREYQISGLCQKCQDKFFGM